MPEVDLSAIFRAAHWLWPYLTTGFLSIVSFLALLNTKWGRVSRRAGGAACSRPGNDTLLPENGLRHRAGGYGAECEGREVSGNPATFERVAR